MPDIGVQRRIEVADEIPVRHLDRRARRIEIRAGGVAVGIDEEVSASGLRVELQCHVAFGAVREHTVVRLNGLLGGHSPFGVEVDVRDVRSERLNLVHLDPGGPEVDALVAKGVGDPRDVAEVGRAMTVRIVTCA